MSRNFERLMQGKNNEKYLYEDMGTELMHKSDIAKKFEMLLDDECFNDYIAQLEKDGYDLDARNEDAKLKKDPNKLAERDGLNQFEGQPDRKEVIDRGNERSLESAISKMYEDKSHKDLGICKYYQAPIAREVSAADVDLVFNNDNIV